MVDGGEESRISQPIRTARVIGISLASGSKGQTKVK